MILQAKEAEDWVIATGITTTVRDFVKKSFKVLGVDIAFKGKGVNEIGYVEKSNNPKFQIPVGKEIINIDPAYYRPTEVDLLVGNASKAKEKLGWTPQITLDQMIEEMILSDLKLFS